MGMFSGLGSGVPLDGFGRRRLDFEEVVAWAREILCKDDRIIWFLGVVQRAALLRRRDSGRSLCPRLRRKIDRKLKGFAKNRVNADFESGFALTWPHYQSLADIYKLSLMKDYSFHFREAGRSSAKPAALILRDHEEMEERLHSWMDATHDPFEYGKRGTRGFIEVGQEWADPEKWKEWGTA